MNTSLSNPISPREEELLQFTPTDTASDTQFYTPIGQREEQLLQFTPTTSSTSPRTVRDMSPISSSQRANNDMEEFVPINEGVRVSPRAGNVSPRGGRTSPRASPVAFVDHGGRVSPRGNVSPRGGRTSPRASPVAFVDHGGRVSPRGNVSPRSNRTSPRASPVAFVDQEGRVSPRAGKVSPRAGNVSPRAGNVSPRGGRTSPRASPVAFVDQGGRVSPTSNEEVNSAQVSKLAELIEREYSPRNINNLLGEMFRAGFIETMPAGTNQQLANYLAWSIISNRSLLGDRFPNLVKLIDEAKRRPVVNTVAYQQAYEYLMTLPLKEIRDAVALTSGPNSPYRPGRSKDSAARALLTNLMEGNVNNVSPVAAIAYDILTGRQSYATPTRLGTPTRVKQMTYQEQGLPPPPARTPGRITPSRYQASPSRYQQTQPSYQVQQTQPRYQVQQTQPRYQVQETQPSYQVQETQPRYQVQQTQPRYQASPSRYQASPSRYQASPSRYQQTQPSYQVQTYQSYKLPPPPRRR